MVLSQTGERRAKRAVPPPEPSVPEPSTALDVVEDPNIFRASNGLVLRLRKVSRLLIADADRKVKLPKPPVLFNPDKEREEENPDDPDYLEALTNARYEKTMASITLMFALGTEPLEIPADVAPAEDESWFEIVESLGVNLVPGNKRLRYAAWLKYVALPDIEEYMELFQQVLRLSGMSLQTDVGEAEATFPGAAPGAAAANGRAHGKGST